MAAHHRPSLRTKFPDHRQDLYLIDEILSIRTIVIYSSILPWGWYTNLTSPYIYVQIFICLVPAIEIIASTSTYSTRLLLGLSHPLRMAMPYLNNHAFIRGNIKITTTIFLLQEITGRRFLGGKNPYNFTLFKIFIRSQQFRIHEGVFK